MIIPCFSPVNLIKRSNHDSEMILLPIITILDKNK